MDFSAIAGYLVSAQEWVVANIPFVGEYLGKAFQFIIDLF